MVSTFKTAFMFTLEQIYAAASKVRSGADFPRLVQELKAMGVAYYDNYVADGHTDYFDADGQLVASPAKYAPLAVAAAGNAAQLQHALKIHQAGQTDYPTFCRQSAEAGVEKWTTHILDMEVIYFDRAGTVLVRESIPQPASPL